MGRRRAPFLTDFFPAWASRSRHRSLSAFFIGARLGLPHTEPLTFWLIRYMVVLIFMLVVALATRAPWPKTALQWLHIGMVGLLLHGVYLGGVCIAISKGLHAGVISLVVGAAPADWRTGAVAQFLPTALATGVFAAVGESFHVDWLAFRRCRKISRPVLTWSGLGLMLYPYAVSETWLLWVLGAALSGWVFAKWE